MKKINPHQFKRTRIQKAARTSLILAATLLIATPQVLQALSDRGIESKTVVNKTTRQSTRIITFHAPRRGAFIVHTRRAPLDIKWAELEQTTTRSGRLLTTIEFKPWNGKSYIEVIGSINARHAVTWEEKRTMLVRAIKAAVGDTSSEASSNAPPKASFKASSQATPVAAMHSQQYVPMTKRSGEANNTIQQPSANVKQSSTQQLTSVPASTGPGPGPGAGSGPGPGPTTVVASGVTMTYDPTGKSTHRLGLPNPSIAAPNAFGGSHTTVFASLGYDSHWNGGTTSDGGAGLGISFGNPHKYVGALVSVNNDTMGLRNESFGQSGGFGLRLNRYLARQTAVALGATNLPGWGAFADASQNYYFAVTQGIRTKLPITLNAGFGTGEFSGQGVQTNITKDDNIGAFAGVGVTVCRNLSLITDWANEELNVGASYGFLVVKLPIFLSAGVMNVTEAHGADYHWQLSAAVSYRL
ncbi:MAG: hypothetical protein Q8L78_07915 [Coxiellaceae bacterium]|nr:hypothetical protein [Coxiellaceae bacterium]